MRDIVIREIKRNFYQDIEIFSQHDEENQKKYANFWKKFERGEITLDKYLRNLPSNELLEVFRHQCYDIELNDLIAEGLVKDEDL